LNAPVSLTQDKRRRPLSNAVAGKRGTATEGERPMVGDNHVVFGVHVHDRIQEAGVVQRLFTEYGCNIKTRIGLHEVEEGFCSREGVILLEMYGDESTCYEFKSKLEAIDGIEVKDLVFTHD
jgi:hypothetical protein